MWLSQWGKGCRALAQLGGRPPQPGSLGCLSSPGEGSPRPGASPGAWAAFHPRERGAPSWGPGAWAASHLVIKALSLWAGSS